MAFNPCCCMTLKTGAFIIGILEIVFSAISLVGTSIALGGIAFINSLDNGTLMRNLSEEIQKDHPELSGGNVETTMSFLTMLLGLVLVLCVIQIIMGSMLIHGIRMERLSLLKVWMIYEGCALALSFILNISVACVKSNDNLLLDLPSSFLSALLEIYFIYVVYRLHVQIRDGSSHRPKPKYEFS